ncbi:MAG: alanine--tRNA ligase [Legionellales bacterium]|nr:alanine--tRNA ligase [Legionellales bacterium]
MKTSDIRRQFLNFFVQHGHTEVASSPLVPGNDPTLLFTNAGMVQFKDVFLGLDKRAYTRATTSQRCVRAGGKHNDLENVGYTARHHTFFEMLGNFSFGDYFKQDAIQFAWNFLTQVLKLPPEKLWITVFKDDDEAAAIWLNDIGIDPKRFSRCGEKDNFWAMGDTGPCGPCSEIFYDHGETIAGGPPGSADADGDRYIEIWNLVFMQFNRDEAGKLTPLPKPSVDTGMGLERIAAVMQGVHNNYDIDLFVDLIQAIATILQCNDYHNNSLRVIADHIRACSFLICDGVMPSNEGRGYVLRRIIRRAIRHGHKLGMQEPFFHQIVKPLGDVMGDAYPELISAKPHIEKILYNEELQFAKTLDQGLKILEETIAQLNNTIIPGDIVFKLYDTYGFPVDLTADIARERQLTLDLEGFDRAMAKQRAGSKEASRFHLNVKNNLQLDLITEFHGYEVAKESATVLAIIADQQERTTLNAGEQGIIILDHSPFYAESGGQVGDIGKLTSATQLFEVIDTTKNQHAHLHHGKLLQGTINVGDRLLAEINLTHRQAVRLNHSATHLLHAALRATLGTHVQQKGSLVAAEYLRFDFSHFEAVNESTLHTIEQIVNQEIRANHAVVTDVMSADAAMKAGAMALFGEKYGEHVRVLSMGDFSKELCGGTHVDRTGDIGVFKIISESGIAAGVRRIEAVTGQFALEWITQQQQILREASRLLKSSVEDVPAKITQQQLLLRQHEKEITRLNAKLASAKGDELTEQAQEIAGIRVLAIELVGADNKTLRDTLDHLKNKLGESVIVLASVIDEKISLIAGITSATSARISAHDVVNYVAKQVGGKGGGRAEMAQAGGSQVEHLTQALNSVAPWIEQKLQAHS